MTDIYMHGYTYNTSPRKRENVMLFQMNDHAGTMHKYIDLLLLALRLFHHGLVLYVHGGQLLPYSVVNLQELSHTAVEANGLPFTEVSIVVL